MEVSTLMSGGDRTAARYNFDDDTDWFTPVGGTAVGLADPHPSFPAGALSISPADVLEVLGPDADELLATANVDVDELKPRYARDLRTGGERGDVAMGAV